MKINIKGTNIELTPPIRAYLEDKLNSLARLVDQHDTEAILQAEVGKDSRHHKHGEVFRAEINLHLPGRDLRAESFNDDLYAAIDLVKDEIVNEFKSFRAKRSTVVRRGARALKNLIKGLYRRE